MVRRLLPTCLFVVLGSTAFAETPQFRREVNVIDVSKDDVVEHATISPILYINRCEGGCQLNPGADDDATTTIPTSGIVQSQVTLSEFAHPDDVWEQVVQCMKEIYSPYNVQVVTERPAAGMQYHMAVLAGTSQEAGDMPNVLGRAISRNDCMPRNNAVSLSYANSHPANDSQLAFTLCHTVGQESAHAFGLDHSFKWLDGRSTCNDPMTYQFDCGGQRFFRNEAATCGEFTARSCRCGSTQNSHAMLLSVFGANTAAPIVPPPTSTVTMPAANQAITGVVVASAGSKRGISRVELIINGFKWGEAKGAMFGNNGQPNPSQYTLTVPADLPSSKLDIVVRAYDDLGVSTDSPVVASYKGSPTGCVDASTCAAGQKCEAGKCFWDPPAGEIGDSCTYPQFCKSLNCQGAEDAMICTQSCIPGATDACPNDLECVQTGAGQGICYLAGDEGGCCSVGSDDGASQWFVHGGISMLMLGLLLRRRRK